MNAYTDYINLFFFKTAFNQFDFEKHIITETFLLTNNGVDVLEFYFKEAPELFTKHVTTMLLQSAFLYKKINEAIWLLDLINYDGSGVEDENMELTPIESLSDNRVPIYLPSIYYSLYPKNNVIAKEIYKQNHPAWLFLLGLLDKWQILNTAYNHKLSYLAIQFCHVVYTHYKMTPYFTNDDLQLIIFESTNPENHKQIEHLTVELNAFYK